MADQLKIDAAEIIRAWPSYDGQRLHVKLKTAEDATVTVTFPVTSLNTVMTSVPRLIEPGETHTLDTWAMSYTENGQDVVLTLRTADGRAVSFVMKATQIQGMATIATYGQSRPGAPKVH